MEERKRKQESESYRGKERVKLEIERVRARGREREREKERERGMWEMVRLGRERDMNGGRNGCRKTDRGEMLALAFLVLQCAFIPPSGVNAL